jgi:hypothetical protein
LLGANIFFELLGPQKIKIFSDGLVMRETKFGWVFSGPVPEIVLSDNLTSTSSNLHVYGRN